MSVLVCAESCSGVKTLAQQLHTPGIVVILAKNVQPETSFHLDYAL